jgi:hypothetical protein
VIGHSPLGKVVRANALGAIAGADLQLARLRLGLIALFPFRGHQSRLQ